MEAEPSHGPERSPSERGTDSSGLEQHPGEAVKPIPVAVEERSFVSLIPQFFIFPLLLVVICIVVWVFFFAPVQGERPISDVLTEIRHSYLDRSRNDASYALSMRALQLEEDGRTMSSAETRQLIDILNKSDEDDPEMRTYLVRALGRAGEKTEAFAALFERLTRSSASLEERIEAIRGLGLCRNRVALDPLVAQLENFKGANQWEPRLITLTALANIVLAPDTRESDRARVVEILESHVEAPHWMVRWNVACILASEFGNDRGFVTLNRMLDREYLDQHVKEAADQNPWLVRVLNALAACEAQDFCGDVLKLTKDSSFPVRNAALKFQEKICSNA